MNSKIHWKKDSINLSCVLDADLAGGDDVYLYDKHPDDWYYSVCEVLEIMTPRNKTLYKRYRVLMYQGHTHRIFLRPKLRNLSTERVIDEE